MTLRWLYVLVFSMLLSGCATVLPFERELLARGDMQFDSNGALIEAESPPRAEMTKRLVPYASMKSGGVGKEKRCTRVSQLGVPFVAGQL